MLRIEGFGLGSWRWRKGHATSKEAYRSESLFGIDHSLDSVVHILDEVDLSAAESAQVGDVEDAVVGLGVLAVSTTDLDVVLVCDGLELVLVLGKLGQLDVHRGAHASSQVRRARRDVAKMLVVCESGLLLNLGRSDRQSLRAIL